jgi:polyphosphate kinase
MNKDHSYPLFDRELSWLAFNHRVLQEALDPTVPLFSRLDFLAIFSSNLDEFFRVRVASLRSLLRLKSRALKELDFDPQELLRSIHETVVRQQTLFGAVFERRILPELAAHGIVLRREVGGDARQREFLERYFREELRPRVAPRRLREDAESVFLKDRHIYLVTELWPRSEGEPAALGEPEYGIVEIPSPELPRFVSLPTLNGRSEVLFLDDVLRHFLPQLYPTDEVGASHAVKLSRDAELYLEDEFTGDVADAVRRSLKKRETGLPCRFLYDLAAPPAMVAHLQRCLRLAPEDLVQGGRYHNLHDLHSFPRIGGEELSEPPLPPLPHPGLEGAASILAAVAARDRVLHLPYHSFEYVLRFLEEAADDPTVEEVWITLYRVARDSRVVSALVRAAERGKRVHAFVEVTARFDEAANLEWAERLEAAGVRTIYSMPKLKVHAKLALVVRREDGKRRRYAYLSTGNFNEKTARVYTDHGLFTADPRLTRDVRRVFAYLAGRVERPRCEHLLVAPFTLRRRLERLLAREAEHAAAGEPARVTLKLNSLEDRRMIARLYDAGRAGVEVRLLVRGICCLVPGLEGASENIEARSIVDRFLEHARVYLFHDAGEQRCYLASADWMTRNLARRVEVAFPLYDEEVRAEVLHILALQLADDTRARVIDAEQRNAYVEPSAPDEPRRRAQLEIYDYLRRRAEAEQPTAEPESGWIAVADLRTDVTRRDVALP